MPRDVILASGSPRRRQILAEMGVTCKVVPSDFEEYLDDSRPVRDVAIELGLGKARAVAAKYPNALVIGSDCIVSIGKHQYGKPADEADARRMLTEHASQMALVTTSVIVICKELGLEDARCAEAKVYFKALDPVALEAYLASGDWHDKAGGWGIQSGAAPLINHIDGDYTTIVGLPAALLAKMLQANGVLAKTVRWEAPVPQINSTRAK